MTSWIDIRVDERRREAIDIYSFRLVRPDGASLPSFSPGAHVDVEIAPGLVRQYSISNSPLEREFYRIAVLRERPSRGGSQSMIENVGENSKLRISEPRNNFELATSAERTVLIAGGIGITPLLSMASWLSTTDQEFVMHYAARTRDRMAFVDTINASSFADRVFFHLDDGEKDQRLNVSEAIEAAAPGKHLYVCGPEGLINAVRSAARNASWLDEQIHREYFKLGDGREANPSNQQFVVKLAKSGRQFTIPVDRTIVDILLEEGIEIPVSCEQGVCGTCRTRVLSGIPDHRDVYFSGAEHELNDQFTPCCSRSKTAVLVLDL